MKRREFITLLGGAAVTWPLGAGAQQPAMLVIGFLRDTSLAHVTYLVVAFRRGLKEAGFIEGQNVVIEYRSAEDQADRLPALVADLVRRRVALIVGNTPSALAAKSATTTVPIVFVTGGDPVVQGFVASLNRPGGHVTGVSFLTSASGTKRLELLRHLMAKAAAIAMLVDVHGNLPQAESERRDVQAAAHAIDPCLAAPVRQCNPRVRQRQRDESIPAAGHDKHHAEHRGKSPHAHMGRHSGRKHRGKERHRFRIRDVGREALRECLPESARRRIHA